ncbi:MAG: rhomboid family intramembrane serine protease [Myxococcota bacterium]
MIPIRDINPRVRVPFVNFLIMAGCGLAFGYQLSLEEQVGPFIRAHGFVPARLAEAPLEGLRDAATAMFLHGGWFHVLGNLLYLRVFGDNVEDRLGHLVYPAFYVAAGLAGALAQWAVQPDSTTPMVGASGAIAGVLGAYLVMFPKARVVTLFPVFIFLTFIEVPAVVFLGIWGLQQFLNGYATVTEATQVVDSVAWFAHIGGFVFGVVVGIVMRLRGSRRRIRRKK